MKRNLFIPLFFLCSCPLATLAQANEKTLTVEVSNPWNRAKSDEPVVIKLNELNAGFRIKSATVMDGNTEIPSQLDDLNGDRRADELAFVINLPAQGKKTLKINLSSEKSDKKYEPRVYAEMLVSDKRGNMYRYIRSPSPAMSTSTTKCIITAQLSNRNWWPTVSISIISRQ